MTYLGYLWSARTRMGPVWLLLSAVVVGVAREADTQCWDRPSSEALDSDNSMLVMRSNSPLPSSSSSSSSVTPTITEEIVFFKSQICPVMAAQMNSYLVAS